jgi:hypothetical protein
VFLDLKGFNESFPLASGEDVDLGFRFSAAGFQLQTEQKAIVWHVGRPSFWEMIVQSYHRGYGSAILMIEYPQRYSGLPRVGLRGWIKSFLDQLVLRAKRVSLPLRPLLYGSAAALRRGIFAIAEISFFVFSYIPKQFGKYRNAELSFSRIGLYLILEWCDYLPQLLGQVYGTYAYASRQIDLGE